MSLEMVKDELSVKPDKEISNFANHCEPQGSCCLMARIKIANLLNLIAGDNTNRINILMHP